MKILIIGSGPAGYPAALKLKEKGADVKIIERWTFGGTCLNRGCIPSKAILEIAHRYHNIKDIKDFFDGELNIKPKWDKIKEHKNKVVNTLRTSLEKLFMMKKIEVIKGNAKLIGNKKIEVKKSDNTYEIYDFDKLIIATGTTPFYPPPFDKYKEHLTDSDKVFDLEKKPEHLIIVGAGVIGIEMACFFNAIGTDISVIDIMPNILAFEDDIITRGLKQSLEKRGIKFYLGIKATDIKIENNKKTVILENGQSIDGDEILIAAGRTTNLKELNLESENIKYNRCIEVNQHLQTSNPDICAIGDVNGLSLLAHSAEKQAEIVLENILENKNLEFDKNIVPICIYSWPEFASVGINTKKAKELGLNIKIKKAYFQVLGKAIATMHSEGLIQIITDENDIILGAQILGGPATELIHIISVALKQKLTTKQLNSIIFAHPTMSEIIKEAIAK